MATNKSDVLVWTATNTITTVGGSTNYTTKTPGFELEVLRVTGAVYNADGAVLPSQQVRDKILFQIQWQDTQTNLSNVAMDFFDYLEGWKDYQGPKFILDANVNVQFTWSIDTSTALWVLADYPLRLELNYFGIKTRSNQ